MRVVLFDPPPKLDWTPGCGLTKAGRRWPSYSVTGERTFNYFYLSAGAVLRQGGHEPVYLDCQVAGLGVEAAVDRLVALAPDLVVWYVDQINIDVGAAILGRARERTRFLCAGCGPFVTPLDEEFLKAWPVTDLVIRGEFDLGVRDLADGLVVRADWREVPGASFLQGETVYRTGPVQHVADVDALPIPAYDLINLHDYTESVNTKLPVATMTTSRGCPYRCVYCWWPQTLYSHKWRPMSPERVLAEVKHLVREHGVREIEFDDDIFEFDRDRVVAICEGFRKEGIKVFWSPQCRPDKVDRDLLRLMRKVGCKRILYGCESGVQEVLDRMKKDFTVEDIARATRETKAAGIDVLNCFMLGFPWDTEETLERTVDFACRINAHFTQFGIPTPLPGTEFMRFVREEGYLLTDDWSRFSGFSQAVVSYPHLPRERLEFWEKEAYRQYYLRARYMGMMAVRSLRSFDHLHQTVKLFRAFLKRRRAGWM
ncbi:MAG: radical SAM protein [Acidobacteria bacterium]|nr:radical SAM protein [Acidobacteriota bacterium]